MPVRRGIFWSVRMMSIGWRRRSASAASAESAVNTSKSSRQQGRQRRAGCTARHPRPAASIAVRAHGALLATSGPRSGRATVRGRGEVRTHIIAHDGRSPNVHVASGRQVRQAGTWRENSSDPVQAAGQAEKASPEGTNFSIINLDMARYGPLQCNRHVRKRRENPFHATPPDGFGTRRCLLGPRAARPAIAGTDASSRIADEAGCPRRIRLARGDSAADGSSLVDGLMPDECHGSVGSSAPEPSRGFLSPAPASDAVAWSPQTRATARGSSLSLPLGSDQPLAVGKEWP